ncbi:transglycosylase [Dimargaris verticillata]|uniref:Transglycosylase n=1 Tax=Dimargaris verticillata TaxID=2761393 RepID=A0A9W8B2X5_9FUNG|nr:transglycosylase [Dimargaris verticillata]
MANTLLQVWILIATVTVFGPCTVAQPPSKPTNASQVLTKAMTYDFSQTSDLSDFEIQWGVDNIFVRDGMLQVVMDEFITAPTIVYSKEIPAGKIDVVMKAAAQSGVATALMLYETKGATVDAKDNSYPNDEIDIEIVGKDPFEVQTMFFRKGKRVAENIYSENKKLNVSTAEVFIHYGLELTNEYVKWYINHQEVRSYSSSPDKFPRDARFFRIGVWAGIGRESWAGPLDLTQGPFTAQIQSIMVTPYANGEASSSVPTGKTTASGDQVSTVQIESVPLYESLWNRLKSIVNANLGKLAESAKNFRPVQLV